MAVKEAGYKGLVRAILEYGSSVKDHHGVVLQDELESVQKRSTRIVTVITTLKLEYDWHSWAVKMGTGYPQDVGADKDSYPQDRRADKNPYPHDKQNQCLGSKEYFKTSKVRCLRHLMACSPRKKFLFFLQWRAFFACNYRSSKTADDSSKLKEPKLASSSEKALILNQKRNFVATRKFSKTIEAGNFTEAKDEYEMDTTVTDITDSDLDEDISEEEATRRLQNLSEQEKRNLGGLKQFWLNNTLKPSKMPTVMSDKDWLKLVKITSFKQQKYMFRKLANLEKRKKKKEETEREREMERMEDEKSMLDESSLHLKKLTQGGVYTHHYYKRIYHCRPLFKRTKGYQSLMFGRPLVLDFTGEKRFQWKGYFLANIMTSIYNTNIEHPEPFHLHLAGVSKTESFLKILDGNYFIDIHHDDLCHIFPVEKLVYLSPHSDNVISLEEDSIPVLGSYSFHVKNPKQFPWELKRAEQLGVRTAFLPVNNYMRHTIQHRERFPVLEVLKTLLDYNFMRDWEKASKHMYGMLTEKEQKKLQIWTEMKERSSQTKAFINSLKA